MEYTRIVREYDDFCTFGLWAAQSDYSYVLKIIYKIAPKVYKQLIYCNRAKLKSIMKHWNTRLLEAPNYDTINDMISAEFGVSADTLIISRSKRTEKQKEASAFFKLNHDLWKWIFSTEKTPAEKSISSLYHRLNNFYRDNPAMIINVAGQQYLANTLKKKVLFKLTIDDIKSAAKTIPHASEEDFITWGINLIESRDNTSYAMD